jgi:hypothetical protein
MSTDGVIKGESLKAMLAVGAHVEITVQAEHDEFVVVVGSGLTRCALLAKRGHIRRFRSLDTAAHFLTRIGCKQAVVDLERWTPQQRMLE